MPFDETIGNYLKKIRVYKLLSFEEEMSLAARIEQNDEAAFEQLVNSNLRIVVNLAKRYAKNGENLMDYIQEGNLGLMNAARKFRASFGVRFSTYSCWWIRQYIIRAIHSTRNMIKLPFRKEILLCKINRTRIELKSLSGLEPSAGEIAFKLKCPEKDVVELVNLSQPLFSIDATIKDENSCSLEDFIQDNTYNPEANLLRENAKKTIQNYFRLFLEAREYDILYQRLNLDYSLKRTTLKELADRYSVSQETIKQTEQRAVNKLKEKEKFFLESLIQM